MAPLPFKVLVAGGGIAGTCLAYWLSRSRHDIQITIIERSTTPRITGQAVDIRSQAVEIIDLMGLKQAILDSNTTETGTAFLDINGKLIATFEQDGNYSATSEFEILRADLADIFLNATKERKNIEFIYGESIDTLSQDDKGVTVTFTGGKKAETFAVVVGADGLRSKTRNVAFDPAIGANPYHPLGLYVGYFSIPRREDDTRLWYWYNSTKGRVVMTRPHKNPDTIGAYLCLTMPSRTQQDPRFVNTMEQGSDEVKKLLREYFEGVGWQTERILDGMDQAKDFYATSWDQVRMPKWTNGRVALIGDAAVATPGVGTSYAIIGAYILAGEISKMETLEEVPAALENFEKALRPLLDMSTSPGVFQLANPQTEWGVYIKNTLLRILYLTRVYKLLSVFAGLEGKAAALPKYTWSD